MDIIQILCYDVLPLLFFIGAGFLLDAKFPLDIKTYNKLVIYIVLPCFIFFSMVQYKPSEEAYLLVSAEILLLVTMSALSALVCRLLGIRGGKSAVFRAAATYSNAGNIGSALVVFIYSHAPYATGDEAPLLSEARGDIILLMILMNIAVNIVAAARIRSAHISGVGFLRYLYKMPALYAALAGLAAQTTGITFSDTPIWPILEHFSGAFIVLVTVIVGANLRRATVRRPSRNVLASTFLKLLVAPAVSWLIITGYGNFSPVASQIFFIVSSIPASFTIVMYAAEYENHPDFAAQITITNTIASLLTMTGAIYLARILFPV